MNAHILSVISTSITTGRCHYFINIISFCIVLSVFRLRHRMLYYVIPQSLPSSICQDFYLRLWPLTIIIIIIIIMVFPSLNALGVYVEISTRPEGYICD